jgi:hypothetical protein
MSNPLKFIKLPRNEKKVFFQAIYYLIVFRIKLTRIPPKTLFAEVAKATRNTSKVQQPRCETPERIARMVHQASRFVPNTTCLSKALAGFVIFTKNYYKSDLHIGVFVDDKRTLEAHAWLSYDGRVIIGDLPDLSKYQELPLMLQENEL